MRIISGILTVSILVCGLIAAHFWGASTKIYPRPAGFEPVVPELRHNWWILAKEAAEKEAACLNRRAAAWSALGTLLAFASTVFALLPD
jgi:hypothetical protein